MTTSKSALLRMQTATPGPSLKMTELVDFAPATGDNLKAVDYSIGPVFSDASEHFQTPRQIQKAAPGAIDNPNSIHRQLQQQMKQAHHPPTPRRIHRKDSQLDIKALRTEDQKNQTVTAQDNKQVYMDNYGISLELPTLYVLDTQFFRRQPEYMFQLTKIVISEGKRLLAQTHSLDGTMSEEPYDTYFEDHKDSLALHLLELDKSMIVRRSVTYFESIKSAKMAFSNNGELFAVYLREQNAFKALRTNSLSAEQAFQAISTGSWDIQFSAGDTELGFIEKLEFDENGRYLIAYGQLSIFILYLDFEEGRTDGKLSCLSQAVYESIHDLSFVSEPQPSVDPLDGSNYQCFVAAKRKKQRQIQVFDFSEQGSNSSAGLEQCNESACEEGKAPRSVIMNFRHEATHDLQIKISSDFNSIVFTDINEKFILERQEDGFFLQRKLYQLEGKVVRFIQETLYPQRGFSFLACRPFDTELGLYHSHQKSSEVQLPKDVEPGILKIQDFLTFENSEGGMQYKRTILVAGMRDNEFIVDRAQAGQQLLRSLSDSAQRKMKQNLKIAQNSITYGSFNFSSMSALSFNWPYIAFSGINDHLTVINADRRAIKRVQVSDGDQEIEICATSVTDSHNVFVLVQTQAEYKLYMIDINFLFSSRAESTRVFKDPILTYMIQDVDSEQFVALHVRGSSKRESYDTNEILMVFLLHGTDLYSWSMFSPSHKQPTVSRVCSFSGKHFLLQNESQFYFLQNSYGADGQIESQEIMEVQVNYSTYDIQPLVELEDALQASSAYSESEVVVNLNLDREKRRIILLTKKPNTRREASFFFRILDIAKRKITFTVEITSPTLIGKLSSGLYSFVDGHLYFNNNVIKIRYDLILASEQGKEEEFFDSYEGIFNLSGTMRVRSNTPLDSMRSHRFAYYISDRACRHTSKLLLLPYLHDRKLFLHRVEVNTDYFYTSVRTPIEDEVDYHMKVSTVKQNENEIKSKIKSALQYSMFKSSRVMPSQSSSFNSIIALNYTQHKFQVFSQNGLLINEVSYQDVAAKYGSPIATSSNGLNFVFRHNVETLAENSSKGAFFKVQVFRMNIFGMFHIKEVNLMDNLSSYLRANEERLGIEFDYSVVPFVDRVDKLSFRDLIEQVEMNVIINDNMDLAVTLRLKKAKVARKATMFSMRQESDSALFSDPGCRDATPFLVYLENGYYGFSKNRYVDTNGAHALSKSLEREIDSRSPTWQQRALLSAAEEGVRGFNLTQDNLILWSKHRAFKYTLDKPLTAQFRIPLMFELDEKNQLTFIREIKTGSNPHIVVLVVQSAQKIDILIVWNCLRNYEIDAHEVRGEYIILWDQNGNPYFILEDRVIFIDPKAAIKAYQYQEFASLQMTDQVLSDSGGHCFDGDNHNWFILREFLAMPFSYMTFVIKDKIEREDDAQNDNKFDLEPYTYIFNKSTAFMDSQFVRSDHIELRNVLEQLKEKDEIFLELLHYTHYTYKTDLTSNEVKKVGVNSPLHIAVDMGNSMSVEILLEFMTFIKTNNSRAFADIFPSLVEFNSFIGYFADLSVQTSQMRKKHVFRIGDPHNDLIVAMKESKSMHVDDSFYQTKMGEVAPEKKNDFKSYPVDVMALRIGWIFTTENGRLFLEKVFWMENLEIYKIPTIQMIVEFLYSKQKSRLLYRLMPAYFFHFFLFYLTIFFYEDYADLRFKELGSTINNRVGEFDRLVRDESWLKTLNVISLLAICLILYFNYLYLRNKGLNYFLRFYSWLDMINITQNLYLIVVMFSQLLANNKDYDTTIGNYTNTQLWNKLREHYNQFSDVDSILIEEYGLVEPTGLIEGTNRYDLQGTIQSLIFESETKTLRIQIIFCILVGYIKMGQFLSLTDSFAPIVDQIAQICIDIRFFVIILLMSGACFASCFYVLGQSQLQFDGIKEAEDLDALSYTTVTGSLWYVWENFALGNPSVEIYEKGEGSQNFLLSGLFVAGAFIVMIHLLNMLIAIMGNTFTERSEVAAEIRTRDHLRFVLENWHLNKETIKDVDNVKYIVTAFSASRSFS